MIKRIFIANRGEIAVRINRAARLLGIETVQAYSSADAEMLAVKMADSSVCVGDAAAADSYLNIESLVKCARDYDCDAIHPGYGFLSENPAFARAVQDAGLIFIGPSPETIERMGDKASARSAATSAGVPVVPGSASCLESVEEGVRLAADIGYPVLVKAAAGGGGRGMRLVHSESELRTQMPQAASEARSAFGDDRLYLEKVISRPRHIEVQILGDGKRAVHCFERDCSIQRRRQKVWEESPAPTLSSATRQALCESAVRLAECVGYRGAGTVEYVYDTAQDAFYFIEMNTRIQVEHPVTEMVTGVDLVAEMIRLADGTPLTLQQSDIRSEGHSIEVRINAEDPDRDFMPFPGVIEALSVPEAPGIRFDHFLYEGYRIPPFYDSLLGKLIVKGKTREEAVSRMEYALSGFDIKGIRHTGTLHKRLCQVPAIQNADYHTEWLENWLKGTQR